MLKHIQKFKNFCKQYDCVNVKRMMKKSSEVEIWDGEVEIWDGESLIKILLIAFDDVLGMFGHSVTAVERNIPTFIL